MTLPTTFPRGVMALVAGGLAQGLSLPTTAKPAEDGDFSALQAEA